MKPGTLICAHLQDDNRCGIYETRPAICRIDSLCGKGISQEEVYRINARACNILQRSQGIPESFRLSED